MQIWKAWKNSSAATLKERAAFLERQRNLKADTSNRSLSSCPAPSLQDLLFEPVFPVVSAARSSGIRRKSQSDQFGASNEETWAQIPASKSSSPLVHAAAISSAKRRVSLGRYKLNQSSLNRMAISPVDIQGCASSCPSPIPRPPPGSGPLKITANLDPKWLQKHNRLRAEERVRRRRLHSKQLEAKASARRAEYARQKELSRARAAASRQNPPTSLLRVFSPPAIVKLGSLSYADHTGSSMQHLGDHCRPAWVTVHGHIHVAHSFDAAPSAEEAGS